MCMEERNIDLDCLFRIMAYHSSLLAVRISRQIPAGEPLYIRWCDSYCLSAIIVMSKCLTSLAATSTVIHKTSVCNLDIPLDLGLYVSGLG